MVAFHRLGIAKLSLLGYSNDSGLKLHSKKSSRNGSHFEGGERSGDHFNSILSNGFEYRFEILFRIDQRVGCAELGEKVSIGIPNEGKSVRLTNLYRFFVEVDSLRIEMAVFKGIEEIAMLQKVSV